VLDEVGNSSALRAYLDVNLEPVICSKKKTWNQSSQFMDRCHGREIEPAETCIVLSPATDRSGESWPMQHDGSRSSRKRKEPPLCPHDDNLMADGLCAASIAIDGVTAASLVYWTTEVAADECSADAIFFLA
jgi:hypothetical protein